MSKADDLLNDLIPDTEEPDNKPPVISVEPINEILLIDPETRTIYIPESELTFGVSGDRNVERKYFKCPRIVGDNIDLSTLIIRIPYQCSFGYSDIYSIDDLKVDGEYITFSWLLNGNMFVNPCNVSFAICAIKTDSHGNETNAWNTVAATGTILSGLSAEGMDESEEFVARDILQQLINMLDVKSEEAVRNVTNTTSEQIETIENKGAEVLASIPEDYTTTYNEAEEAVRTKADAIVLETSGEAITVDNSSDDHIRGLKIFGKSGQITTTGKNLFNVTATDITLHGVTFTINSDGTVTVNGTATNNIFLKIGSYILEPGNYIISGCSEGSNKTCLLYTQRTKDSSGYVQCLDGDVPLILGDSDSRDVLISVYTGATISNKKFYPMIRLATVEDSTYEPYTGGKPAPNPDYPQDIRSLGDNDINVVLGAKNLFQKNSTNENNAMVLFPGTYYCKRFFGNSSETNARLHIKIGDSWKTIGDVGAYDNSNIIVEESAFSWYKDKQKLTLKKSYELYYGLINDDKLTIALNDYLELYEDSNNRTIIIPRSLPAIPVPYNGTHTDPNGQQWICDEIDFERGVYVQRVGKAMINNNNYVGYKMNVNNCNQFIFELYKYDDDPYIIRGIPGFCNKFKTGLHIPDTFSISTVGDKGWGGKSRVIFFVDTAIETIEDFMNYIGDDCEVLSQLPEPIETPLTQSEINAFKSLHTNYPHTTVLNSENAFMELKYNVDTKTYINQNGVDSKPVDFMLLTDTVTGKVYRVTVTNGQLTLL